MVALTALWMPIVLSAVLVFVASSLVHMVIKWHRFDYDRLPNEDPLREAMLKAGVGPGNYAVPCPTDPKQLSSPEMLEKYKQGPVGFFNVIPSGPPVMGKYLLQWFVWLVVVGVFVAYLAGRTLGPGTDYLQVFRVSGAAAFLVHGVSTPVASIWNGRTWGATGRFLLDGVIYTLLTAGSFGWLWPE